MKAIGDNNTIRVASRASQSPPGNGLETTSPGGVNLLATVNDAPIIRANPITNPIPRSVSKKMSGRAKWDGQRLHMAIHQLVGAVGD